MIEHLKLSGSWGTRILDKLSTGRFAPEVWGDRHIDAERGGWKKLAHHFGAEFHLRCAGKRVLEVGSAAGLEVMAVAEVATDVVGLEIRQQDLDLARARQKLSPYDGKVYFGETAPTGSSFDVIYSIDSMEHFQDPLDILKQMRSLLAPGGHIYFSFGPTWYHPYGAHMSHITKIPWVHLIFRDDVVLKKYHTDTGHLVTRYEDTGDGLNRMTISQFWDLCVKAKLVGIIKPIPIRKTGFLAKLLPEFFSSAVFADLWRT